MYCSPALQLTLTLSPTFPIILWVLVPLAFWFWFVCLHEIVDVHRTHVCPRGVPSWPCCSCGPQWATILFSAFPTVLWFWFPWFPLPSRSIVRGLFCPVGLMSCPGRGVFMLRLLPVARRCPSTFPSCNVLSCHPVCFCLSSAISSDPNSTLLEGSWWGPAPGLRSSKGA